MKVSQWREHRAKVRIPTHLDNTLFHEGEKYVLLYLSAEFVEKNLAAAYLLCFVKAMNFVKE